MYFDTQTMTFQSEDPEGAFVALSEAEYCKLLDGRSDGKEIVLDKNNKPKLKALPKPSQKVLNGFQELAWVESELPIIRRQLEAIEEDEEGETPPDILPGTRKQWLGYRGKVTNWKDSPDFPDQTLRPSRPTGEV